MLIHAIVPASRANGPDLRAVVFFQGCTLGCRGCWNPTSHAFRGREMTVCALNHKVAFTAALCFLTTTAAAARPHEGIPSGEGGPR